ncbi:MAG: hypothetical protein NZ908_00440 [Candidatus Micrarchaeota archaeon]|nr:hypothetical protein [Candidatus Micrarchaeota archaeon]MCX8154564.1 hypothetical protein [Candidatus Micrarchaeota archaeon]
MIDEKEIRQLIVKLHELVDQENQRGLERIDETIYKQIVSAINELKFYRDLDPVYGRYYNNILELYTRLVRMRMMKIVMIVTNEKEMFRENLTDEEYRFYEALRDVIIKYKSRMLNLSNVLKVEILEDISEYYDLNGNRRGPYRKGDIVEIDREEAEWMIREGKARRLD